MYWEMTHTHQEGTDIMFTNKRNFMVSLILGALLTMFFVFSPSASAHTSSVHASQTRTAYFYSLTLQGNIDNAITFSLPATLAIVSPPYNTSGSHPVDLCLFVGSEIAPYSNPVTGAISLNSQSSCSPGFTTSADMGTVSYDKPSSTLTLQIDPNASALGVNAFNTSGGIAGGVEIVISGTMAVQLTDNAQTVNGQIAVIGNESAYSQTQGDTYSATFTGSYTGSQNL